ncbi:MAG: hypothetical protein JJE17_05425 [Peptostreptococcaceae bacterium]|nr:hypothetical protein [Peptostreptococcaceae bacterium]
MIILVLESSTSGAKALRIDTVTGDMDIKVEPYAKGTQENAEEVWKTTAKLGKQLAATVEKVDIIALGGVWHSVMLCDKHFKPVTRVYHWYDTSSYELCTKIRNENPSFTQEFYSKTGCRVHSLYPYFKLLPLKMKGQIKQDYKICGQGTFNFFQLTGDWKVSKSMASGTGLFDIHNKVYHQGLLGNLGIDSKTQLGKLVDYESTSPLSKEGAKLLGLPSGIPVVPCHPDGALNQIGSSANEKGIMTLSIGTSGAMRLSTDKPILNFEKGNWCYYGATKSWLSGAATSGCCNCVDYYKDLLFSAELSYRTIEDTMKEDNINTPIFLPFLFGERCPGWDDGKKASFFDCKPEATTQDYYQAVLEGVLFNLYQCFDTLSTVEKINCIKVSGGILQSKTWKQMCADIFGLEIEEDRVKQCSLFGGAKLAAMVLKTQIPENTHNSKVLPNMKMHDMYMKKYNRYLYWYDITKEKN